MKRLLCVVSALLVAVPCAISSVPHQTTEQSIAPAIRKSIESGVIQHFGERYRTSVVHCILGNPSNWVVKADFRWLVQTHCAKIRLDEKYSVIQVQIDPEWASFPLRLASDPMTPQAVAEWYHAPFANKWIPMNSASVTSREKPGWTIQFRCGDITGDYRLRVRSFMEFMVVDYRSGVVIEWTMPPDPTPEDRYLHMEFLAPKALLRIASALHWSHCKDPKSCEIRSGFVFKAPRAYNMWSWFVRGDQPSKRRSNTASVFQVTFAEVDAKNFHSIWMRAQTGDVIASMTSNTSSAEFVSKVLGLLAKS